MHLRPSFLPISSHSNIIFAPVKLIVGHFARERRLRASVKPPVDRRRQVTDPQLRQEVATAVKRNLRANPPGYSSVDDVEAVLVAVITYVCMYVCMVTHIARVWIKRVRLPVLLVVS